MRAVDRSVEVDFGKGDGLVPAVVQDADDGRVLMLGYMDPEALERTREDGRVWFHSRRRGGLWMKGETSGNILETVSVHLDCDADTLLVRARPAGPVCHRGPATCFHDDPGAVLAALEARIGERARTGDVEVSYTARLLGEGPAACAQKVGEEGVETALAGAVESDARLVSEAADLLYHLLVLLRARGVSFKAVLRALAERAGH